MCAFLIYAIKNTDVICDMRAALAKFVCKLSSVFLREERDRPKAEKLQIFSRIILLCLWSVCVAPFCVAAPCLREKLCFEQWGGTVRGEKTPKKNVVLNFRRAKVRARLCLDLSLGRQKEGPTKATAVNDDK